MNAEADDVRRAATGDRAAFDALAEHCRPWLFGLCFRLVRDRSTAEDLVQETLLRAFAGLAHLRHPCKFRPWLSRIALNLCRMHLRSRPVPADEPVQDWQDRDWPQTAAPLLDVDEALQRIDAESRRLLLLFYVEGLSHRELADLLSFSAPAVKSRLHRARQHLRKEILAMMTDQQKARLGIKEEAPCPARTILLVEPDADLCNALSDALTSAGYVVESLATGEDALKALEQRRAHILILDKHCGEPNWVEALTLLMVDAWSREHVKRGVIIDPANQRDVILAWQAGADFCLTRPPQPSEVVALVNKVACL